MKYKLRTKIYSVYKPITYKLQYNTAAGTAVAIIYIIIIKYLLFEAIH